MYVCCKHIYEFIYMYTYIHIYIYSSTKPKKTLSYTFPTHTSFSNASHCSYTYMCLYIYICMYSYICIHLHKYLYSSTNPKKLYHKPLLHTQILFQRPCIALYIDIYILIYIHAYIYTYMYTCTYIHALYIDMYILIYIMHIYIHIYTHIHIFIYQTKKYFTVNLSYTHTSISNDSHCSYNPIYVFSCIYV